MRGIKRVLARLILFLVAVGTLVFILENRQAASLIVFGWSTPELPISVFIMLSLLLGMVVSPVLGLMLYGRMRMQLVSRQRQLAECRKELAMRSEQNVAERAK